MEKGEQHQSSFTLVAQGDDPLRLRVEPWGDELILPRGAKARIIGSSTMHRGELHVEYGSTEVVVFGWVGSVVSVQRDGETVIEPSVPVPATPDDEVCQHREDGTHCVHWWDLEPCCDCRSAEKRTLGELVATIKALRAAGRMPHHLTRQERIDWVFGNCALSNPAVTREMVEAAVGQEGACAATPAVPIVAGPDVIDPTECVSCGRKRAFGDRPCGSCVENARQEASDARHRNR